MSEMRNMAPLRRAKDLLADRLEDPGFRVEWYRLAPARAVALRLVSYRAEHGLTQTALGRRLGMPQPAVARLESGEHLPTLDTLIRIAEALDVEFLIDFVPGDRRTTWVSAEAEGAAVVETAATAHGGRLLVAVG